MNVRVTRATDRSKGTLSDGVCAICLESLADRDTNQLPCGHTFHSKCIMTNVLTNNSTCPMCRNDFARPTENEEEEDDESERMLQFVADRLEAKFEKPEITTMLEKFDIPDDTSRWRKRRVCELLAEQLTQETDDEEDA